MSQISVYPLFLKLFVFVFLLQGLISFLSGIFALCIFVVFSFRRENCIILKNVGRIGGDAERVRQRLRHILSAIDKGVDFRISDVHVRGSAASSLPPIYEVVLEDDESARDLREAFKRFTRQKSPVTRPAELDGVGVYNSVTLATRVRISILRVSRLLVL